VMLSRDMLPQAFRNKTLGAKRCMLEEMINVACVQQPQRLNVTPGSPKVNVLAQKGRALHECPLHVVSCPGVVEKDVEQVASWYLANFVKHSGAKYRQEIRTSYLPLHT
jgi:hypothetical protein